MLEMVFDRNGRGKNISIFLYSATVSITDNSLLPLGLRTRDIIWAQAGYEWHLMEMTDGRKSVPS
jgi:hypothetical protein